MRARRPSSSRSWRGTEVTASVGVCAFCSIVNGSDPQAQVVGEGEDWVAFFPLHPATTGHTLVVPREHLKDFWTADASVAAALATACVDVGKALRGLLEPEGMNLITSAGDAAEQTVFHLHLHVVPRWADDDIDRIWPPPGAGSERASDDLAQQVRHALEGTRRA